MADLLELFTERAGDYRAGLHHCTSDQLPSTLALLLAAATSVVVPTGLPAVWTAGLTSPLLTEESPANGGRPRLLCAADLDVAGIAVLTGCALAIAETGTLVLDAGPGQGRRLLTLVPDHHVCVVRADQIVPDVPDMLAALPDPTRPITMISGPSATSDIELLRVEGVHGPRHLDIVVVT